MFFKLIKFVTPNPPNVPKNEDHLLYIQNLIEEINTKLKILKQAKWFVNNLQAQYFLTYKDFHLYSNFLNQTRKVRNTKILSQDQFNLVSKKHWIHLSL